MKVAVVGSRSFTKNSIERATKAHKILKVIKY